jgi:NAD(P)-dependent dehydrogenase (short-subunit alcohol dehydrogenase family)
MMPLPAPPRPDAVFLPANTFKGCNILVTGGGTGLGNAMALAFARLGGTIVVASRSSEHREAGLARIEAADGRAIDVEIDVREPESVAAAFDSAERLVGPIDILINNAAGNFPVAAETLSPNGWRAVTQIVLDGTFFCSTEFARRRIARGEPGCILNIGAAYGWTGGPGTAPSAAAKAGVMNLTKSLAVEWAPDGIRVNGLVPGTFPHDDAPMAMRLGHTGIADLDADLARRQPAGRVGETHEFGWAACYLCSPYAAFVTGHNMVIDGGNWLRRGLKMPEFQPVREWADTRTMRS